MAWLLQYGKTESDSPPPGYFRVASVARSCAAPNDRKRSVIQKKKEGLRRTSSCSDCSPVLWFARDDSTVIQYCSPARLTYTAPRHG